MKCKQNNVNISSKTLQHLFLFVYYYFILFSFWADFDKFSKLFNKCINNSVRIFTYRLEVS